MVRFRWNTVTDNILCEQDDAGQLLATYTHEPGLYGELISQRRDGQTSYYHFDVQGSTGELTDENQNVTDTYTYDAFGVEVARTGSTMNPFTYKGALGYITNPPSNEIYVRYRQVQVGIARWTSLDPLVFRDLTSGYAYCRNNPINFVDPGGMWPIMPLPSPTDMYVTICLGILKGIANAWKVDHPCAGALLDQFLDQVPKPNPCPKECQVALHGTVPPIGQSIQDCIDMIRYQGECDSRRNVNFHIRGSGAVEGSPWPGPARSTPEDDLSVAFHGFNWDGRNRSPATRRPANPVL